MKQLSFVAACLYYYGKEAAKLAIDVAVVMALLFMIHKLVGWFLWVLSM